MMMAHRKIHAFFSRQEQEQPIRHCGEVMTVCEVSSSVPEDASIDSAENSMARSNEDSTSVNEPRQDHPRIFVRVVKILKSLITQLI